MKRWKKEITKDNAAQNTNGPNPQNDKHKTKTAYKLNTPKLNCENQSTNQKRKYGNEAWHKPETSLQKQLSLITKQLRHGIFEQGWWYGGGNGCGEMKLRVIE